jgi:N-ethylmaleimide reductase
MPEPLFAPFQLGDLMLANRMVMAPMTRNRADRSGVAPPMMATYYQQRASAGLIITESAPVSAEAVGYPFTPGIYTNTQAASWLRVTDAVHSAGGRIFAQLQHCGRISHPSLLPVMPLQWLRQRCDRADGPSPIPACRIS